MKTVRWNIAVSKDTDQSVRMLMATQGGGRKGDLSRFIEEAVRSYLLKSLKAIPAFANSTDAELVVARDCLALAQPGVAPDQVPSSLLEMIQRHATDAVSGRNDIDVDGTFARSEMYFLHWNRRTNEWSEGIAEPDKASDGKRGGWIFFEVSAPTMATAKEMCEKYITSKKASFKGGIVTLLDASTAVVGESKIAY